MAVLDSKDTMTSDDKEKFKKQIEVDSACHNERATDVKKQRALEVTPGTQKGNASCVMMSSVGYPGEEDSEGSYSESDSDEY